MSDEVSAVTGRMDVIATELGALRAEVNALKGEIARRHDNYNARMTALAKDLKEQIKDNRESLVELVGKRGGAGTLKDLRQDMTKIGELCSTNSAALQKIMQDNAVISFQTKVMWAAGGTIIGAVLGLLVYLYRG